MCKGSSVFHTDLAGRSQGLREQQTVRLMMIDHHRSFTESLAYRINSEDHDLNVIGTATNAETGMQIVLDKKPDMVVFETELPGRGAFDAAYDLSERLKETKIVFFNGISVRRVPRSGSAGSSGRIPVEIRAC